MISPEFMSMSMMKEVWDRINRIFKINKTALKRTGNAPATLEAAPSWPFPFSVSGNPVNPVNPIPWDLADRERFLQRVQRIRVGKRTTEEIGLVTLIEAFADFAGRVFEPTSKLRRIVLAGH